MRIQDRIDRTLGEYRNEHVQTSLHSVYDSLVQLSKDLKSEGFDESFPELDSEIIAFSLRLIGNEDENKWNSAFGPWITSGTKEIPPKESITKEVIEYWQIRAKEEISSFLSSRYNDLLWEFQKRVTGTNDIGNAHLTIDGYIKCFSDNRYQSMLEMQKYIQRARKLSVQINDEKRQILVERAMLKREDEIAQDNLPGTWGDVFEFLTKKPKLRLSEEEKSQLLLDMNSRLLRMHAFSQTNPSEVNPNSIIYISQLLSNYYRYIDDSTSLDRILTSIADICFNYAETQDPFTAHHWLTVFFQILTDCGFKNKTTGLSIQHKIQELGPKMKGNLEETITKNSMPGEKVRDILRNLKGDNLQSSLFKFAYFFYHNLSSIEEQINKEIKSGDIPISLWLAPTQKLDHNGRIICSVGTIDNDPKGHAIMRLRNFMARQAALLASLAIEQIFEIHHPSPEEIIEILYTDSLFQPEQKKILTHGLVHYFSEDYVAAIHILSPQIEVLIRTIIQNNNGVVYVWSKASGSEDCKGLGKLLDEAIKNGIFSERMGDYLRTVLVDSRGFNIRNIVSHGLADEGFFCKTIADRMFHVILLLSYVK